MDERPEIRKGSCKATKLQELSIQHFHFTNNNLLVPSLSLRNRHLLKSALLTIMRFAFSLTAATFTKRIIQVSWLIVAQ
jgi:hypothetical protein